MKNMTIIPDRGQDKAEARYQRNRQMYMEGREDGASGDYIRQDFDNEQDREFYDFGYLAGVGLGVDSVD